MHVLGDDYAEVRDPDRQILGQAILPHQVILEERIGEGQFGDVHKGILYPGVSGCGFCCEWVWLKNVTIFLLFENDCLYITIRSIIILL